MGKKLINLLLGNQELLLIVVVASIALVWYWNFLIYFSNKKMIKKYDLVLASFFLAFIFESYPLDIFSYQHLIGDTNLVNILIRLFVYAAVLVAVRPWFDGFLKNSKAFLVNSFLAPLIFWALISFAWSGNPFVSLRSVLVVIGVACFSAHFARRYDLKQLGLLLRGTILVCSILSVLSVIARTPLPGSIGISWVNLEGSFSNKVLASLIALNVSLWTLHAVENPKTRWISGTIAAISFVSIFFMNSVTNIATSATLVYVILLLRAIKRFSLKYVPLAIWASLIIGILSGLAIQIYAADIAGGFGKDTSLSGRTKIWPAIIEQIAQKPWTGYGYDGYWQTSLRFDLPIPVLHSHNGLLELGLQLGIPGIILYLVSLSAGILIAFKHFFRHSSLQTASLPLLLLIYTQVTSFAETYRLGVMGPNYIWFFFVLTQISLTSTSKNS